MAKSKPQPATPKSAAPRVQPSPAAEEEDPVLRQNAPIHCPYCKTACVSKGEGIFTRYYCANSDCGRDYSTKIARPKLSERIGPKPDELSAR